MSKKKNSKQGPNAFYLFMIDWKKQEEKKGVTFPNGLKDVQSNLNCSESWKNLSLEQKNCYKDEAKRQKHQLKNYKKTSTGESLNDVTECELKETDFIKNMKIFIASFINEANINNRVPLLKFYIIHVNYFYQRVLDNNILKYYPAEISIAEFCLKDGVTRNYSKIINSKIEKGYAYEATEHSKNSHQIPTQPEFGESDYEIISEEIDKFLEPGKINGKIPPLYTQFGEPDVKCPAEDMLNKLADFNKNFVNFKLYSIEELFMNMFNVKAECHTLEPIDAMAASVKLKTDPFSYNRSLECDFHQQLYGGGNYCSSSYTQRWILVLCSVICPLFDIDLQHKSHLPSELSTSELTCLDDTFQVMSIRRINKGKGASSTSGACSTIIKPASERNFRDEQERRNNALSKPLTIIDKSLSNSQNTTRLESTERPGRLFTRPPSLSENSSNINFNETDFPSIGRGFGGRRIQESKPKKTDYASRLK